VGGLWAGLAGYADPMTILRASVTAAATGTDSGVPVPILVDGADSSCTASGLQGYIPTPGDRLLVQQVGSTVEVVQFLSQGTVPYVNATDFASLTNEVALKTVVWNQTADPTITNPGEVTTGDEWVRPDQDNARYRWDGLTWVSVLVGAAGLSQDMLQGKVVPINTAATLEWGVPDPSLSLSGASESTGAEPWAGVTYVPPSDVQQVGGVCPNSDGTNFTVVEVLNTNFKWRLVRVARATGVRTVLGTITVGVGSGETVLSEQCGGIAFIAGSYYLTSSRLVSGGVNSIEWNLYRVTTAGALSATMRIRSLTTMPDYAWLAMPRLASDGSSMYVVWYDNTDSKYHAQGYNVLGATAGSQINSTTTHSNVDLAFACYGTFDFGASRFLIGTLNNGQVVSMTTAGVIQATEGWTATTSNPGGICWDATSGRIVTTALQRFTAQTADLTRWAAYSWADINATGGTHETALAPAISMNVPKRLVITLSNLPVAPGANAGGTDAPSTFNLYMSATNGIPSTFHLVSQVTYPVAKIAANGDISNVQTALAVTTFPTGASGALQSQTGGFQVKGDGTGAWPALVRTIIPAGVVMPYAGATAPTGFYLCDGSAKNTTTDAALFAIIGYTFGGSGTSFNLPDLRGRNAFGVSATHALGTTGGAETHTLTTGELPSHSHTNGSLSVGYQFNSNTTHTGTSISVTDIANQTGGAGTGATAPIAGSTAGVGSGDPVSLLDPFLALNYIIRNGN
jgi:microcystin-dependent protein